MFGQRLWGEGLMAGCCRFDRQDTRDSFRVAELHLHLCSSLVDCLMLKNILGAELRSTELDAEHEELGEAAVQCTVSLRHNIWGILALIWEFVVMLFHWKKTKILNSVFEICQSCTIPLFLTQAFHELPPFKIPTVKSVYVKDSLFYHCSLALVLRILLKCFSVESKLPFLPLNPPYLFVTLFKGRSDWGIKKISHSTQR